MMNIDEIKKDNTVIFAKDDKVVLKGEIDQAKPGEFLNPFFENVISQMNDSVILDVQELEFMNSSGLKAIITFVMNRKKDSKLIIKVDMDKTWQKTSLKVVASLDSNIIIE